MDKKILGDIHEFWFGRLEGSEDFPDGKSELWFKQSDKTDSTIEATFGAYISPAAEAAWALDELTREQQVGLVILLDQFPRNIFRTSADSFAYDVSARKIARHLIEAGRDRFFMIEQTFIYLPFEHSEDVADQDFSVYLYSEAALAAPAALAETFRNYLTYATKHRDLIVKFGRFPHRNALLGRQSTPEEEKFLKEHGRGY